MKISTILVVFLVITSGPNLEAGQFSDPTPVQIKVHDTQGLVLDNVTFRFDDLPTEVLSYEDGEYTLEVPSNITTITIDSPGYSAISMDVTHLKSIEQLSRLLVTLQAPPKQFIPERIVVPND